MNPNPWDEGFRARQRGEGRRSPYAIGSPERQQWMDGWDDLDEHFRDRDECWEQTFGHKP